MFLQFCAADRQDESKIRKNPEQLSTIFEGFRDSLFGPETPLEMPVLVFVLAVGFEPAKKNHKTPKTPLEMALQVGHFGTVENPQKS